MTSWKWWGNEFMFHIGWLVKTPLHRSIIMESILIQIFFLFSFLFRIQNMISLISFNLLLVSWQLKKRYCSHCINNLGILICCVHFNWEFHSSFYLIKQFLPFVVQWNLDLRKPDLRKNLDLRKIVSTTNFLVHKLFDLRKIF